MKIIQLIDTLNPGGAERMCVNIANVLQENGYDVQVCTTRGEGFLKKYLNPEISHHVLNKKNSIDVVAFLKFLKIIRREKPEIIHAHSTSIFWAVSAKYFKRDIKVIWHDHLGKRTGKNRSNVFYRIISSRIDGIISVNEDIREWARKNMKVAPERIQFIVNFPHLRDVPECKVSEKFTIVCIANLLPVKDHETLLKAVSLLVKEGTQIPVKVIFAGTFQKNDYYFKLVNLINNLGLNQLIEIAGPVEDIASLLARADCGVLSSVSEGLPVTLLEYGMAALPVVVTNVGQCAEVVGNGEYGRVVPPKDPEAMAKEILYLINNRNIAIEMGKSFMKQVQQKYGPDVFLNQYKSLLNRILRNA